MHGFCIGLAAIQIRWQILAIPSRSKTSISKISISKTSNSKTSTLRRPDVLMNSNELSRAKIRL